MTAAATMAEQPASTTALTSVTAVLSMLHERADRNSATRLFRGEPVLSWTLSRLVQSRCLGNIGILCWEDQLPDVEEIAEEYHAYVLAKGPRQPIALVDAVAAARRWADGWRGGLLSACDFDLGFYGPWVKELAEKLQTDATILLDPSSGLVDPSLIDLMIDHAEKTSQAELCFAQAAPGLSGALLRPALLERLSATGSHPGRLLHYMPEQPMRDPIGTDACVPLASGVARSLRSFRLDSDRQIQRIGAATVDLNGTLASTEAEELVHRLQWSHEVDALPREITIELNTQRRSKPIFAASTHLNLNRPPATINQWLTLLSEAGESDDLRLTIGGAGDPLESELLFPLIDVARECGIKAIHVQTDLLTEDVERIERLAASAIDVVSVHVPAMTSETYASVMGVDAFQRVLENIAHFARARHAHGRSFPLMVPVFVKTQHNLAEMETFYDQWLKMVGCAVIEGPRDYAGQIPDVALADMAPPRRSACARLNSRLMVLCDGTFVACEQDVLGVSPLGRVGKDSLRHVWTNRLASLRSDHNKGAWSNHAPCGTCREWHRP
jgi:MoaA/NifB/PqqE/SkfB family radical SAM enzyme